MACFRILTNLPAKDLTKNFWTSFMPVVSNVVQLSSDKLICVVSPDSVLNIGGDTSSLAVIASLETSECHAKAIDNQLVVDKIGNYFESHYQVPKTRIFMTVQKIQRQRQIIANETYCEENK